MPKSDVVTEEKEDPDVVVSLDEWNHPVNTWMLMPGTCVSYERDYSWFLTDENKVVRLRDVKIFEGPQSIAPK